MQTGILVGLVALAILGVGVVGASGVMAPAGGMQGGMSGLIGGGSGMNGGGMMSGGTCDCQTSGSCQPSMDGHNHTWDRNGMMP